MKQPEALRLAEQLEMSATNADMGRRPSRTDTRRLAASELRRLHEVNQELLAALELLKAAVMSKGLIKTVQALSCANAAITKAKEQS